MSEPYDPSEPRDPQPQDAEERVILKALQVLEVEAPERGLEEAVGTGSDADATLRRLYVETLGLLAWGAPEAAPPERAKSRLMEAIAIRPRLNGVSTRLAPAGSAATGPSPAAEVVPLASARRPAQAPAPAVTETAPSRRGTRWLAALAAVLAAAGLGLAGWFYVQLDRTQETLARLQGERTRLAERLDQQEELIRRSAGMGRFLSAVSTAGVEICPLRPVGDPALHPQAFAILYMPPGSGEWYLLATNLERSDGVYKVWLNTPDGAVPVGSLEPGDESALEIVLPPDIEQRHELMLSILVTLEPVPDPPDPSGPMVLFGDDVIKVL